MLKLSTMTGHLIPVLLLCFFLIASSSAKSSTPTTKPSKPSQQTNKEVSRPFAPKTWWGLDLFAFPGMEKDITFLISALNEVVSCGDPQMYKHYLFLLR